MVLPCGIIRKRPWDIGSGGPGEFGAQIRNRPIRVWSSLIFSAILHTSYSHTLTIHNVQESKITETTKITKKNNQI